jgi:hypothetical protein
MGAALARYAERARCARLFSATVDAGIAGREQCAVASSAATGCTREEELDIVAIEGLHAPARHIVGR